MTHSLAKLTEIAVLLMVGSALVAGAASSWEARSSHSEISPLSPATLELLNCRHRATDPWRGDPEIIRCQKCGLLISPQPLDGEIRSSAIQE